MSTTNFPTSLDSGPVASGPLGTDYEDTLDHAGMHEHHTSAVKAIEARVGITNSAVTSSHAYKIKHLEDEARARGCVSRMENTTLLDSVSIPTPYGAFAKSAELSFLSTSPFTFLAGRLYQVQAYVNMQPGSSGTAFFGYWITERLKLSGTIVGIRNQVVMPQPAFSAQSDRDICFSRPFTHTGSASITYSVQVESLFNTSGTTNGNASVLVFSQDPSNRANNLNDPVPPAWMAIFDIGPA